MSNGTDAHPPTKQGFHWYNGFSPISITVESLPYWYFIDGGILQSRDVLLSVGDLTARVTQEKP